MRRSDPAGRDPLSEFTPHLPARLLGFQGVTRQAMITQGSMPVSMMNTVLAVEFGISPPLVAGAVVVSTTLCTFTLNPLPAWLQ